MNIKSYKHPLLFYALSTLLLWTFWRIAGYLSHQSENESMSFPMIIAFIGLITPMVVSLFLLLPNKELKQDFLSRFLNFDKIKLKYIVISCLLMLTSILLAQLISLLFGYSSEQFHITGTYTFTSGVFPSVL